MFQDIKRYLIYPPFDSIQKNPLALRFFVFSSVSLIIKRDRSEAGHLHTVGSNIPDQKYI